MNPRANSCIRAKEQHSFDAASLDPVLANDWPGARIAIQLVSKKKGL